MDFEPNDDQRMLKEEVRTYLQERFSLQDNMRLAETIGTCGDSLWTEMSQLGWMGIPFPEQYGGVGLGLVELCLVLEEMGRNVITGPYFASVVLGGVGITVAGSEEQKARWLPSIIDGSVKATLAAYDELGLHPDRQVSARAAATSGGYQLTGTKRFVLGGDEADLIICPARVGNEPEAPIGLFAVPAGSQGVVTRRFPSLDITRPFSEVRLDGVVVPADHLLGDVEQGSRHLTSILDFALAGLCSEIAGACRRLVEMATDYARERVQFGRPIGAFQAIKHKCADMHVRAVTAEASSRYLAWNADQAFKGSGEQRLPFSASIAKAYCADALNRAASDAIQIHGGNGFSWEYGLHLYLKRAKACEQLFGDTQHHHERVIRSLLGWAGLSRPAAVSSSKE